MRTLLVMVMVAGCNGDDGGESERTARPCEQLRDHLVELRLAGARGTPTELAAHREAMQRALGDDFTATCEKTMTTPQIACAASAGDLAAVSECSASATQP